MDRNAATLARSDGSTCVGHDPTVEAVDPDDPVDVHAEAAMSSSAVTPMRTPVNVVDIHQAWSIRGRRALRWSDALR
jgi:hypothetical protein